MLHVITSLDDPLCALIADDPVRPEIPIELRVNQRSNIFVLLDLYGKPLAVVCVAYRDRIPATVEELGFPNMVADNVAVFYTIWSYSAGAGRKLIQSVREWISQHRGDIDQFVTLSPTTDMARIFHLRNGASVFRVNAQSVNYQYQ